MTAFLSAAWCDELAATLRDDPSVAGVTFTLQQVIKDAPDGAVAYWIRFGDGDVTVALGKADSADVTLELDHATALELESGDLIAQAAFMQGKLKVTGNMGSLLQNQAALAAVYGRAAPT